MNHNTIKSDQDIANSFLNGIQEGRQNMYLTGKGHSLEGFLFINYTK